ncbi:transcriptional regulator, PadR-family (plasmid) [Gemmatirosa kalamazoonensis]|uniref:Transcriptional regulator, PadR-family n=1 Tax=Gemmatirosa kalamazoonensis TaxID=861299 RepID=W0RMM8_9BACT|nr:PadR family transcriptional regulator [Gemmatirosa kalamazoonensis]AHG92299.1 transcriptional regulator, PadR-family [Gemmatirosa kalamazoonensis]
MLALDFYRRAPVVPPPGSAQSDALRGTVDLLALKALVRGPMHGWGVGQRIGEMSTGLLDVNQGSLYPALQRLEYRGLIASAWDVTENGRRARYYRLTAAGRRALDDEVESWRRFAAAIELVLSAT